MPDAIHIRPAEPGDADVAAILLYSAYTHTPATYPPQDAGDSGYFIEHLRDYFRQKGNRFSYQHAQVAVGGSEVVGLVLGFGGRDEPRLNAAVGGWLAREAKDGEWYIDALAVLKKWTRQGIGAELMHAAERQARAHHYPKIALNVAVGNKAAIDLYTHLQYVVTEQTIIYGRPYVRMVKTLEDGEQGSGGTGEEVEQTQGHAHGQSE